MTPSPLSLHPQGGSTPLANQVAGHQNVMSDESGALVIKPALPREIAFYHLLNSASRSDPVTQLKPFVPKFFGTLRLEGQLDSSGQITKDGIGLKVDDVPESVVIENLAHNYTHPSILDVKLGTVLAGPDATEEKKIRMEKQSKGSTSFETGIRLTGCQTWHAPTFSYILTPKSYGKSITKEQLPEGLIRFFPLPDDSVPALHMPPTPVSSTSTSPSSSTVPHLPLPPSNDASLVVPTTPVSGSSAPPQAYTSHAIQAKTLLRVLSMVDAELEQLENVISKLEARFIGASILIVYEGHAERLEDALDRWEAKKAREALIAAEAPPPAQDSDDEDEFGDDDGSSIDSSTSSDDDEDDGAKADARRARRCPPMNLRMIDFAHTRLVEGEGADEGVLKGIRTLRGLVQNRAEQVRQKVYATSSVQG